MSQHRFNDFDVIALAGRIAQLISYGQSKKEIVDTLRRDGISDDHIFLGYAAATMILETEQE